MRTLRSLALGLALLMAGPALADRYSERVLVTFIPTTAIGGAVPRLNRPIGQVAVDLRFVDGRPEDQRGLLGTRTNDADALFDIRTSNDLMGVAERGLRRRAVSWGLDIAPIDSDLRFQVTLMEARVTELNQAVGATYKSSAVLQGRLSDGSGALLWEGTGRGGTSRYGRPASPENASEVISDALVEAFSQLLSARDLQAAWMGDAPPAPVAASQPASVGAEHSADVVPPRPAASGAPMSPEELLAELLTLQGAGFAEASLVGFLATKSATRALSAQDMLAWKRAGLSEAVVQAALTLPVP
jgi:hypothetical protein